MCVHECNRTLKDLREEASENCGPVDKCSDDNDEMTEMVVEEPEEKWDCETILCEFFQLLLQDFISE